MQGHFWVRLTLILGPVKDARLRVRFSSLPVGRRKNKGTGPVLRILLNLLFNSAFPLAKVTAKKKRRLGNILVQTLGEFVLVNRSAVRWQSSLLPCFGRQTVWFSNLETFPVWNVWKFPSWNFSIFPQFQRTSERCRCPNRSRLALGCVFLLCLVLRKNVKRCKV